MVKPGRAELTSAPLAASTHSGRDTTNPATGKKALLGGSDTGLPGDAGEVRIHAQLRRVQADRRQAENGEGKQEAQGAEEQAVPADGISGQKVQVDVKFVPEACIVDGRKYYQFTAVDECTWWTYRQVYDEHST